MPRHEFFVPGRLCLFGEHSDWAGGWRVGNPALSPGYCLVAGTDHGLTADAEPHGDALLISARLPDGREIGPEAIALEATALDEVASGGGFFSYAAGTAREIVDRYEVGGLRLAIRATLPIGKGLSSSAAACVLVGRAFSRVFGLGLSATEEMDVAYRGERRANSECGRMDQVCALGRGPVFLRFDGEALDVEPLVSGGDFHLLVVDLRRGKDTRSILASLNACFPDAPGERARAVREALGPRNSAVLAKARAAIIAGDAARLGALMIEAQSIFDRDVAPVCEELRAPRLHRVLEHPAVRDLAFGGKGVGSQGDGCAQIVTRGPVERSELATRLEQELDVHCLPLTIERGER